MSELLLLHVEGTSGSQDFIDSSPHGRTVSPIATTRTLGELGEALSLSIWTPAGYLLSSKDGFYANKDYVYQNKPNKGKLKVNKAWSDALPILYSIQKWQNLIKEQTFMAGK